MKWFYIDESITSGDRRQGPFTFEEILEFAKEGKIKEETLVWHTGLSNWVTFQEVNKQKTEEETNEIIKNTLEALILAKEKKAKEIHYAGFFIRAIAYLIDFVFLCALSGIALFIFKQFNFIDIASAETFLMQDSNALMTPESLEKFLSIQGIHTFVILCSVIQFLYFVLFNAFYSGTPGKLFLKIKIIRRDGKKLGFTFAVIRYFTSVLSSFSLLYFYGLAYLIVFFDPERRSLHDWLSLTRVIYTKPEK